MPLPQSENYVSIYTTGGEWRYVQFNDGNTVPIDPTVTPQTVWWNADNFADITTITIEGPNYAQSLNPSGEYGWTDPWYQFDVTSSEIITTHTDQWGSQHNTTIYSTSSGAYLIISPLDNPYSGPFLSPLSFFNTSNTSAVCFLEGTDITTDQGPIPIEQLTQNNTIYGSKINNITQSDNFFGHLIHFKPNSLAQDLPSTDTFATPTHAIFCPKDKQMKMAKDFCDGENVVEDFTKDKTSKIYNVVCEDDKGEIIAHSMYVNNMLCECLHPHAYPLVKNQLKW